MNIKDVKKLTPFERICYWIQEREAVRLKKESGQPKPWTDDTILQNYRFCNVRRMDDKVSKWLLENWYDPNWNHKNIVLAVALARFINKPETLQVIGFPKIWSPGRIKAKLRQYRDQGNVVFNGAYMVRGNDGIDKIESVVDYYVDTLRHTLVGPPDTTTMESCWEDIKFSHGFGSFMAGQVTADLRWAMSGTWTDKNDWAPIGPGSRRGMNRLLGRDVKSPMGQDEFLGHLQSLITKLTDALSTEITTRLEAMDIQNCCCEFDKMERTLFDGRRPKQKYPGVA